MKHALIISGGEYSSPDLSKEYSPIIACDKGYLYAVLMRLKPDVVIGDFDSYKGKLPTDIPVIRHPVEKDDTDTMLAVRYAIKEHADAVTICCALGGRMDHLIANIQTLSFAAENGLTAEICSEHERLRTLTNGELIIPKKENRSLSVFSLTEKCTGVTISGAKYSLSDGELTSSFPLGFGNTWEEENVTVSVKTGTLLIVESEYYD